MCVTPQQGTGYWGHFLGVNGGKTQFLLLEGRSLENKVTHSVQLQLKSKMLAPSSLEGRQEVKWQFILSNKHLGKEK